MASEKWPPVASFDYDELRPILAHIRVMRRFLKEVIEPDPELNPFYAKLDVAYGELLQTVLAPYAHRMAVMLVELEDAYTKTETTPLRSM